MPARKASEKRRDEQPKDQPELQYEEGIAQLEALVERMEEELSLEETLAAYERGMALHAQLEAVLKRGERRVQMLATQNEGEGPETERIPFESESEIMSFELEE